MPTDNPPPVNAGRRALFVGGLVAAGGAAALARGAFSQITPVPHTMADHDMSAMQADPYAAPMAGMAHGDMMTVGVVDHARNGCDPTPMLTDWLRGTTSTLPEGRTLRTFEIEAVDKENEIAPGIFFPAWTFNGRVPGPALRATEGERLRIVFTNSGSHRIPSISTASMPRGWMGCRGLGRSGLVNNSHMSSTPNLLAATCITATLCR